MPLLSSVARMDTIVRSGVYSSLAIALGLSSGCGDSGSADVQLQALAQDARIMTVAEQADPHAKVKVAAANGQVDFAREIRPLLSDRCFACHGPDAASSERLGGFRLDSFEHATAVADSGRVPIVPGEPENSELIRRINAKDKPGVLMPPPDSHLKLTESEIQTLTQWIEEGAEYTEHWAYESPVKPALPKIEHEAWARNAIDYFIAAELEQAGLSPSEPADRATLIRRVSLDLTGLPPTPAEIDAFVNDKDADAYEKVVDRLLASPHYGERLAVIWLDAARYGDTNGFHHDNIRNSWPYREWVINAFNQNKPYDEFVVEQLAGDLLPNATDEDRLASSFCRMHNINDEGGALDEEYRVEAIADRIETVATVFMAQTFTCARCHDHKYDPISQEDYFSLYAYFNSVDEKGVYRNNFEQAQAYPARMDYMPPRLAEQITQLQPELGKAIAERESQTATVAEEQQQWEHALRQRTGVLWATTQVISSAASGQKSDTAVQPDGSVLLTGEPAGFEDVTVVLRTDATDLRMMKLDALPAAAYAGKLGVAKNGNAVLSHVKVRAVSVEDQNVSEDVSLRYAWADHEQQDGNHDVLNALNDDKPGWAVAGHQKDGRRTAFFVADKPFGYEGGTELHVTLRYRSFYANHTLARTRLHFASANDLVYESFPTVASEWFEMGPFEDNGNYQAAFDKAFGPESLTDITSGQEANGAQRIAGKMWEHRPDVIDGQAYLLRGENRAFYFGRTIKTPVARDLALSLGSDDGIRVYLNGEEVFSNNVKRGVNQARDEVTLSLQPGNNALIVKIVNAGGQGGFFFESKPVGKKTGELAPFALVSPALRSEENNLSFSQEWRKQHSPTYRALNEKVEAIEAEITKLRDQAVPVVIMKELDEPVPMYILERGAYDGANKDKPVSRRPPASLGAGPLPEGVSNDRLGFARWLTQPDHPLTSRVHVNRIWQMIFGTGIVKTSEDFGSQADWPSHRNLLDYLAMDFVESGWNQKHLIKKIVMSASYQQSARRQTQTVDTDPENRMLSYFPRRRLQGEFIRDQALFVAGLLKDDIGGPSVRPYQPGDLWREVAIGGSNSGSFKRDDGDALYRRSMYTFWKKTSPPPQMATFNAPTREFCVVRRDVTNTPLQTLVLWNDEQFLEAARGLAQRTLQDVGDQPDEVGLTLMFRRCTGRTPDQRTMRVLTNTLEHFKQRYSQDDAAIADAKALLEQGDAPRPENYDPAELAAWMMTASTILSLDETIVRD